jgi:hypothetical protein
MMLDMLHIDRRRDIRLLIKVAHISRQIRIVRDPTQITLKMPDIDWIEPDQRRKKPPVSLGDLMSG